MRKPRTRFLAGAAIAATTAFAAAAATTAFLVTDSASSTTATGTLAVATAKTATTLSITAGTSTITGGQKDTISGTLTAGGGPAAKKVVDLYRYSDRLHRWRLIRIKLTSQSGTVTFHVEPWITREYELVYHGNSTLAAARSGVVTIDVRPGNRSATALSVTAAPASITTAGGTTTISGVLSTATGPLPNRLVFLCRYDATTKTWVKVAVQRTGQQGGVVFVREPSTTATFELVFPGGPRFAGSRSASVTVTVTAPSDGATPAPSGSRATSGGTTADLA